MAGATGLPQEVYERLRILPGAVVLQRRRGQYDRQKPWGFYDHSRHTDYRLSLSRHSGLPIAFEPAALDQVMREMLAEEALLPEALLPGGAAIASSSAAESRSICASSAARFGPTPSPRTKPIMDLCSRVASSMAPLSSSEELSCSETGESMVGTRTDARSRKSAGA